MDKEELKKAYVKLLIQRETVKFLEEHREEIVKRAMKRAQTELTEQKESRVETLP